MGSWDEGVCLLSFGVLTDVQYADRDDQKSWYCDKIRYYRSSLDQVVKAFAVWTEDDVSFVLQLGDLIDASNRTLGLDSSRAMEKVLKHFSQFPIPSYHVLGNHEVDTFPRNQLSSYKYLGEGRGSDDLYYYSFRPADQVTVIVLDCVEISILGYPEAHHNYQKAIEILSQYHTSQDKALWEYDDHLQGSDKRFVSYNGGVSDAQIEWLDAELERADAAQHQVVVCGHLALFSESSSWGCLCWNWERVLSVLHRHSSVVLYLSGHLHDTGYAVDHHGVHHVTLGGIIEVPPEDQAFSTVRVFKDRIKITGFGREKSYDLPTTKLPL